MSNGSWEIDSLRGNTSDLPTSPQQPLEFLFSKWLFGKVKIVYRSFQKSWLKQRPFLCCMGYDEAKDVAFCHTCAIAVIGKKIRAATAEA